MSHIAVKRVPGYSNKLRKINLQLDGLTIDSLKDGELRTIKVKPGKHSLQATIDWCSSKKIEFDIEEGTTKTFTIKGTNPLLSIYYVTFGYNRYLMLEEVY